MKEGMESFDKRDTEDRQSYYLYGLRKEEEFLKLMIPKMYPPFELRANPQKESCPYVIDMQGAAGRPADLKTQETPFFTVSSYQYDGKDCDPQYTVTFNEKDYRNYKAKYPEGDLDIYFWVHWDQLSYKPGKEKGREAIRVEPMHGVWRASFARMCQKIEAGKVALHYYEKRVGDRHNAQDSYLFDLRDEEVFRRLYFAEYSVLIAGEEYNRQKRDEVLGLLKMGLKVLWFGGNGEDFSKDPKIREEIREFREAGFFQEYAYPDPDAGSGVRVPSIDGKKVEKCRILDGKLLFFNGDTEHPISCGEAEYKDDNNVILGIPKWLGGYDVKSDATDEIRSRLIGFDWEQYRVEHAPIGADLMVQAGAGSGKTTVMVERVLYLMHTNYRFDFSGIALITFTNNATDEIRSRLSRKLRDKYRLATNEAVRERYLGWLEKLVQIRISTVDSFFLDIIKEVGALLGYGRDLELTSSDYEEKQNFLDRRLGQYGKEFRKSMRKKKISPHEMKKYMQYVIDECNQRGIFGLDRKELQWNEEAPKVKNGQEKNDQEGNDQKERDFWDAFCEVADAEEKHFREIHRRNNSFTLDYINHELFEVLKQEKLELYLLHRYDYLFVDEFQDCNQVQIDGITKLWELYRARLFVVGDPKQGIYRFRGACDGAFDLLLSNADRDGKELFPLDIHSNHRIAREILDEIHEVFLEMGEHDLLNYTEEDRQIPSRRLQGRKPDANWRPECVDYRVWRDQLGKKVRELLEQDQEVVCLIRESWQTQNLCKAFEDYNRRNPEGCAIKCLVRKEKDFFTSPAVLDFCALAEALYYENEPMYLYQYIQSAYYDRDEDDAEENIYERLFECNGDRDRILACLKENYPYLEDLVRRIRHGAPIGVLYEIVKERRPVENYRKIAKTESDVLQYQADLDKLMRMLEDRFLKETATLGDICRYLRVMISTEQKEEVARIPEQDGEVGEKSRYVKIMTVHASKGLTFENVILPFTYHNPMAEGKHKKMIVQEKQAAGLFLQDVEEEEDDPSSASQAQSKKIQIPSPLYEALNQQERRAQNREEARLLYVAMTRATSGLYCLLDQWNKEKKEADMCRWCDMIFGE